MRLRERRAGRAPQRPWLRIAIVPTLAAITFGVLFAGRTALTAPNFSTCAARAWGSPLSLWVARGEELQIRTMVGWSCPERTRPYDLAIVVDAPALAGDAAEMERDDLTVLVRRLSLEANDQTRLGLVGYGLRAAWLTALGSTTSRHLDAVRTLAAPDLGVPTGSGGLAAGMHEGLKMLSIGRRPIPDSETVDPARQSMVVLAAPEGERYCDGFEAELARAEEDEVAVTFVCLNGDCTDTCLEGHGARLLSRYAWDIMRLEQERLAWESRLRVERLDMVEQVHESLAIVADSIDSGVGSYSVEKHNIRWILDVRQNDDGRLMLVYTIRPTAASRQNLRALVAA